MTRSVMVVGAGGRMGRTVCEAILDDDDLELVAAVDPSAGGKLIGDLVGRSDASFGVDATSSVGADFRVDASIDEVTCHVDVAVDFTVVEAARANIEWCAASGVHAVVGTTGFGSQDLVRFESIFSSSNIIIAPNFAIGAVLMMRFGEMAAPFFESAEIIELHHENKIDAPSGTAMRTAERLAAASSDWLEDPTQNEVLKGARGGSGPGGIPVHSVRLRGLVAHQELILGTAGQSLTIRHDSYDRSSFMPGVVHACKVIQDHAGLTVGLDAYLGI